MPNLTERITDPREKGTMKRLTDDQMKIIRDMRYAGFGYKAIGKRMKVSFETIKSCCKRNGLTNLPKNTNVGGCKACGKTIIQKPGTKRRKFCCDTCCQTWWNSHPYLVKQKAIYTFNCANCHTEFTAYGNNHRKYCSHACYIADRFHTGTV